ncbi:hypothetical protein GCM10022232_31800 [Streptomyces plumbiresistens]|uniref:Uncharacterized protein n=1 Tax=Streptomyces plumbiresistens TaxID=511811 RepID=A0ABP7R8U6_9ACTN
MRAVPVGVACMVPYVTVRGNGGVGVQASRLCGWCCGFRVDGAAGSAVVRGAAGSRGVDRAAGATDSGAVST